MDQSNGDEVKALKESVSRLAISIKNADSEKREGLKSYFRNRSSVRQFS